MRKINRGKNGIKKHHIKSKFLNFMTNIESCGKKKGLLVSRQVEIMMEQQIKEGRN
jgi:hypothetical protein